MSQNIFDNDIFFKEYLKLRNHNNYNDLLEQPAINELLPHIKDIDVLDLGCGYGTKSKEFINDGANSVVGIDLSKNMLSRARILNQDDKIEYINLDMANIDQLDKRFDLIYSSLSFHYIEDFDKLINDCYGLLNDGGYLIFSQEHPIVSATYDLKGYHTQDEDNQYISYTFSNYNQEGLRKADWFVKDVENYHRTTSTIVNTLCANGFNLCNLIEPIPSKEAIKLKPDLAKELIKPTFLIIKAQKNEY